MTCKTDVAQRLQRLEALSMPSGLLLQPWTVEDGRAATRHGDAEWRQGEAEGLEAFLARVGPGIGRAPLVWISPLDAAL